MPTGRAPTFHRPTLHTPAALRAAPRLLARARARPRRALRRLFRRAPGALPPDFLFGTATSDHQCEAYDPRYPDVWDVWEQAHPLGTPGVTPYVPRGRATDFWNRWPEDVELARQLGCKAFRVSIAWSRVEPEPGVFSDEALAHYRALVDGIVAAGMEPVVTLMHFVWPAHLEARGGLRAPEFPDWFGRYACHVRDALGDRVRYWITINEPNAFIFGYFKPFWMPEFFWPPGLPPRTSDHDMMRATAEVIRNLFLANRAARLVLRAGPGGERRLVSANGYYLGLPNRLWHLPIPLMRWVDRRAASEQGWSEEDWLLREGRIVHRRELSGPTLLGPKLLESPFRFMPPGLGPLNRWIEALGAFATIFSFGASNWWHLGLKGDLPTFLCPPECRGQQDYVAFDYYFGTSHLLDIANLMHVLERRYGHAPLWADGLEDALRYLQGMFPGQPIFIIENGTAGPPNGTRKTRYLREHVRAVQRAHADGVNVIGYLAWSLTTNREWGLPEGPGSDFGLYHVDLDGDPSLTRQMTPAAAQYAAIVRRHGA